MRDELNKIRQGDGGVNLYIRYYSIKLPPYLDRVHAILMPDMPKQRVQGDPQAPQVPAKEEEGEEPEAMAS